MILNLATAPFKGICQKCNQRKIVCLYSNEKKYCFKVLCKCCASKLKKVKPKSYISWNSIDVRFVKLGILPQGRSIRACRNFCIRHGIKSLGAKEIKHIKQAIENIDRKAELEQYLKKVATNQPPKKITINPKGIK